MVRIILKLRKLPDKSRKTNKLKIHTEMIILFPIPQLLSFKQFEILIRYLTLIVIMLHCKSAAQRNWLEKDF